jgi:hypothetical protein
MLDDDHRGRQVGRQWREDLGESLQTARNGDQRNPGSRSA